jgi:uncharacterized protein YbjQ (UPF0145 family)
MAERRFDLVFRGEVEPGQDPETVKRKLGSMLKLDRGRIETVFTGDPVVIKKGLDRKTAAKYQQAIRRTGAVCEVTDASPSDAGPVPAADRSPDREDLPPEPAPAESVPAESAPAEPAPGEPAPAEPEGPVPPPEPAPVSGKKMPMRPGVFILTNIETVPGREIVEHFGLVSGSTIRAKHLGRDFMAGLKNLVGGELRGYTELLQDSRKQAIDRMREEARKLGANAVINVRFSTSAVAQGAAELYVYGTAVRVE